jgi:8-oxo-dGTP pyrophosphatase MutT (NUDIX family)
MSHDEWVDVVDERDEVVGRATRSQMRQHNLLHRNASVLCLTSNGQVYVHQRMHTKDVFPGLYDLFASGVVMAGESYDAAAARELSEELGVTGPALEPLFKHRYEGPSSRSFTMVYRAVWDGPIVWQAEEIAWGGSLSIADAAQNTQQFQYVPDGLEIFQRYLERYPPTAG